LVEQSLGLPDRFIRIVGLDADHDSVLIGQGVLNNIFHNDLLLIGYRGETITHQGDDLPDGYGEELKSLT
jgi:hypothetical protein